MSFRKKAKKNKKFFYIKKPRRDKPFGELVFKPLCMIYSVRIIPDPEPS